MSIHNRLDVCKPFLGLFAPRSKSPPHVSRAEVGSKPHEILGFDDAVFAKMRRDVANASWRVSPDIPGLGWIKRAIIAAHANGLISLLNAQRLIDLTKSWEA